MKKIFTLFITILLCLSLSSCKDKTCEKDPSQEKCQPAELTCDEDPSQEKCQPAELTCDEDPNQEKCQPAELTCEDDPTQEKCKVAELKKMSDYKHSEMSLEELGWINGEGSGSAMRAQLSIMGSVLSYIGSSVPYSRTITELQVSEINDTIYCAYIRKDFMESVDYANKPENIARYKEQWEKRRSTSYGNEGGFEKLENDLGAFQYFIYFYFSYFTTNDGINLDDNILRSGQNLVLYRSGLSREKNGSENLYETIYGEKITKEAFPITFLEFSKYDKIPKQIEDQRLLFVVASRDVVVLDNYSRDFNVGLSQRLYFGLGVEFDGDMGTVLFKHKDLCNIIPQYYYFEGKYLFTYLDNREEEKIFITEAYNHDVNLSKVITIDNIEYIITRDGNIYREDYSIIYNELISCINEEATAKYNYSYYVESGWATEEEYYRAIERKNICYYYCLEYEKTKDLLINYYQEMNDYFSVSNPRKPK